MQNVNDPSKIEDPAKDPQYIEADIDGARRQKDEVSPTKHMAHIGYTMGF